MSGKVVFFYLPVPDLKAARTFYRDVIGLDEAWREGQMTCAFKLPGTDVQLMLDERRADEPERAGLIFTRPDVEGFYQSEQGKLDFLHAPIGLPDGGKVVAANDVSGFNVHFMESK